jgi:hypothetical protein
LLPQSGKAPILIGKSAKLKLALVDEIPPSRIHNLTQSIMKHTSSVFLIASAFAFTPLSATAATVWNVNVGGGIEPGDAYEITTADNYLGAATENTANSVWNAIESSTTTTLADSTGSTSAGVSFTIAPTNGSDVQFQAQGATVGDEIFISYIKDNGNDDPFDVTFGNLSTAAGTSYSLVVYSGWRFGADNVPITQTAGSGLTGTFNLNSLDMEAGNPLATGLARDTDPANTAGDFNYARFDGLTADGSGNLTFRMGGVDAPVNGFQLVQVPEPSSLVLGTLGLLALLRRRR